MKALNSTVVSFFAVLALTTPAMANDFAVALGFRSNSADAVPTGASVSSMTGFGAGVIGYFDLADSFQGRVGFLYNQKNVKLEAGGESLELTANYVDIPVTAMYKFADYAGAFAGPVLGLRAGKECKATAGTTCSGLKDPEGSVFGFQFGAMFKFMPQLGGEVYYEMIPSEYWKDGLKNLRTVGANLLITFE